MNILVDEQHEMRAGWKLLAYWILFAILFIAASLPFASLPETQLARLVLSTITIVPAVGALLLMVRFVDKVPFATFGATLHEHWPKDLSMGLGISAGMLVVLTIIHGTFGGVTMVWAVSGESGKSLIVTLAVLLVTAAQEELIFRGYPLQVLMKGIGVWPAIFTMSSVFGIGHLFNPNATLLGAINTVLAGLMLSIAYLKTRSLWLPYGLHLGWNIGLGFVLGYPLSGIHIDSLWKSVAGGPQWLVGSEYGPEGGLIGTIVFVGAILVIRSTGGTEISPKLRSLLAINVGKTQASEMNT